jgi:hypothetical protein
MTGAGRPTEQMGIGKTAEVQNAGSRYFGHGNLDLNVTYQAIDSG